MRAHIPIIVAALVAAGLAPVAASAAAGNGSWQPEAATYGVSQPVDASPGLFAASPVNWGPSS